MKRTMLLLAAGLAAASMMLLLSVALRSGRGHAATPTPTSTPIVPPVPHYDCYHIDPYGPQPTLPTHLTLQTQWGTTVVANAPLYADLCLPAIKNGTEGSLAAPHVECVPIGGNAPGKTVDLYTQFGIQKNVTVGLPIEACMPATKSLTGDPDPAVPTAPHYECYQITGPRPSPFPSSVTVEDQFLAAGTTVVLGDPTRLCLPAKKNGVGDLNAPHVECFAITSGPTVDKFVYLLTQFAPKHEVHVLDPPTQLCMPVLKTVVTGTGVGGEQEPPDVAGNAGSGGSSLPYAAIAGAAAGLIVLGAGGWYARRRWLS